MGSLKPQYGGAQQGPQEECAPEHDSVDLHGVARHLAAHGDGDADKREREHGGRDLWKDRLPNLA